MNVGDIRYKAAKAEDFIPGIRSSYGGPISDIDFYAGDDLIAWIGRGRSNEEDAFVSTSWSDADKKREKKVLEAFLKEEEVVDLEAIPFPFTRMKLRINREGEFIAHAGSETDSQCGKKGTRRYRFFVSIEASNAKLTNEGFLMENLWVADYFRERYEEKTGECTSCEDMAQTAVEHFLDLFQSKEELAGIVPTRILVRIHGSDVSFIEAEWTGE